MVEQPESNHLDKSTEPTLVEQPEDNHLDDLSILLKIMRFKIQKWILLTIDPVLLIAHLTSIYVLFLWANDFVLKQITYSFGDLIEQSLFAATLLEGTKIFSALGTAMGYGLHLLYSLYKEGRRVVKVVTEEEER